MSDDNTSSTITDYSVKHKQDTERLKWVLAALVAVIFFGLQSYTALHRNEPTDAQKCILYHLLSHRVGSYDSDKSMMEHEGLTIGKERPQEPDPSLAESCPRFLDSKRKEK